MFSERRCRLKVQVYNYFVHFRLYSSHFWSLDMKVTQPQMISGYLMANVCISELLMMLEGNSKRKTIWHQMTLRHNQDLKYKSQENTTAFHSFKIRDVIPNLDSDSGHCYGLFVICIEWFIVLLYLPFWLCPISNLVLATQLQSFGIQ